MTRPDAVEVLVERMQLRSAHARDGDVEHRAEPVREHLVGAEEAHVVGVVADELGEPGAEHARGLAASRRGSPGSTSTANGAVGGSAIGARDAAVRERASRSCAARPSGRSASSSATGRPSSSKSSSGRYDRIHASSIARCSGFSRTPASGTWWAWNVPSTCTPSTTPGPVQPFGVRSTIAGQRGGRLVEGAGRGIRSDRVDALVGDVDRVGHARVHGHRGPRRRSRR